jgi:hypothetical protein
MGREERGETLQGRKREKNICERTEEREQRSEERKERRRGM